MSTSPVPASSHGNLDEQIAQLMQCKPLSEQEVFSTRSPLFFLNSFSTCNFFAFLLFYRFDFHYNGNFVLWWPIG
ncbi:hypothetical protein KSP40_PGU005574 [Platanthera guangdongensis]|uniref:Uncharacterized protein n=1 Tax=Platanthera guangdongensis TaxID=2320717 RepID=A0ABR2MBI2_9ASPA